MARIYTERARRQVNKLPEDVKSIMCSRCPLRGNSAGCRERQYDTALQIAEGASGNLLKCRAKQTELQKPR